MVIKHPDPADAPQQAAAAHVRWHDLECGLYSADLPLWLELAENAAALAPGEPVLDLGAGTGRVSLALARAGRAMIGLDIDRDLLAALDARADGLPVRTVRSDARAFELPERSLGLCIAPMQTIQLLGGRDGRVGLLAHARAHLRPGAMLACAIVTEAEEFDTAAGDLGPGPEVARLDSEIYVSRPVAVRVRSGRIRIDRMRRILSSEREQAAVEISAEANVVELDILTASELADEAVTAGFESGGVRVIGATEEHVGSEVVILVAR
jgi:SAM-dependent methyltransferase